MGPGKNQKQFRHNIVYIFQRKMAFFSAGNIGLVRNSEFYVNPEATEENHRRQSRRY